jgi:hypothetical protein
MHNNCCTASHLYFNKSTHSRIQALAISQAQVFLSRIRYWATPIKRIGVAEERTKRQSQTQASNLRQQKSPTIWSGF